MCWILLKKSTCTEHENDVITVASWPGESLSVPPSTSKWYWKLGAWVEKRNLSESCRSQHKRKLIWQQRQRFSRASLLFFYSIPGLSHLSYHALVDKNRNPLQRILQFFISNVQGDDENNNSWRNQIIGSLVTVITLNSCRITESAWLMLYKTHYIYLTLRHHGWWWWW